MRTTMVGGVFKSFEKGKRTSVTSARNAAGQQGNIHNNPMSG